MNDCIHIVLFLVVIPVTVGALISTLINRRARVMAWADKHVRDMQHARRGAGPSSQGVLRASDFPGTQSIGRGECPMRAGRFQ